MARVTKLHIAGGHQQVFPSFSMVSLIHAHQSPCVMLLQSGLCHWKLLFD